MFSLHRGENDWYRYCTECGIIVGYSPQVIALALTHGGLVRLQALDLMAPDAAAKQRKKLQ